MKTFKTASPVNPAITRCEPCLLTRMEAGVAARIKKLCASPEIQNRLRELGFREEQVIRLVTTRTNCICQVCNKAALQFRPASPSKIVGS